MTGWTYRKVQTFGSFDLRRDYQFQVSLEPKAVNLLISDSNSPQILDVELYPFGLVLVIPLAIFLGLTLMGVLLHWRRDNQAIRRILSPINELALKVDELSRRSFSEDKYQILEQAIEHIDPEEMNSVSLQDEDLAGVEAAMNNLLIRLKESYLQQARFVNDASHELRTPIAIIEGYVNMLDRWGTEDEKVLQESITAIKNESAHMKHLVEQLLFLARGDAGRTTLQTEQVLLKELMQEIYEESLMIDEGHHYMYQPQEEAIAVMADPGLLKQAVRILVDNAAKYTNPGDNIILKVGLTERTTENPAPHPYLQVQDTGIGMAESDVVHMFERFYRSDEVRKYKGTGLGLSISKWIVDKHGGHFEVTSRVELGTRIRIVL